MLLKLHVSTHCVCHLMLSAFVKILCSDLAEKNGMAKRKGASVDLPIKLTLVLDGQDAYELDIHIYVLLK